MLTVRHPRGHVAITQAEHAAMCAELAGAWGNERFGRVEPAEEVRLAAGEHELGWTELDGAPTLDPATGLPFTVTDLDFKNYLHTQIEGPRKLASRNPYAGLLASLHHTSLYSRPSTAGLVSANGRRLRSFFAQSAELQAELRSELSADGWEIERNWRLVRSWDGLSHDLLLERAPCLRRAVPAAGETTLDLQIERRGDAHAIDPWPFGGERASIEVGGRLLGETFSDEERMRAALAAAPRLTLTYDLVAG